MNYQAIYNSLIERGRNRLLDGYSERHHIIPRCMGGNDDSENLVRLTAREHFIVHRLLTKIYPENHKLKNAVWRMCNGNTSKRNYGSTSRVYQFVRTERSKQLSLLLKGKPTNRFPSAETRAKMSAKRKGKKRPPEATLAIRTWSIGKPKSKELKAHLSALYKGRTLSEATKEKMEATKEKKLANEPNRACTICGTEYKVTCLTNKMCSACRDPKPCKCGCGKIVTTPGRFYKTNHHKEKNILVKMSLCECGCEELVTNAKNRFLRGHHYKHNIKKFNCICKLCNHQYLALNPKNFFCESCRAPRACKCGCGELVVEPGSFYKPNHNKELKASFRYSCVCKFCNKEYLAGSSTGKICQECASPRLCKCGCGQTIKLPGKFFRSKRCKLYFEKKFDK